MKKLNQLSTKLLSKNPYWEYRQDRYILPNNKEGDYFYVSTNDSVFIIPILNGSVILTKQFRYLNQKESIEFPGGGINPKLSVEANALKELEEETGYTSNNLKYIGKFNPCNGVVDEICYLFTADNLVTKESAHDESEEFEIININFSELNELISQNIIWDGMTMAAWQLFTAQNKNLL